MVQHTLESVCKEYLIERGESNMNRFAKIYQIAVAGMRELSMDSEAIPTVAILPANTTDSTNLPSDFISLIRLAIVDFNGNLQALNQNDDIAFPRWVNSCGDPVKQTPIAGTNSLPIYYNGLQGYADNFRNAEAVGRMFGVGGGNNVYGNFRIDRERSQIVFGNLLTNINQVVLEYLSDLKVVDGKYVVHPFLIEALKTWIQYGDIRFNTRMGLGEKQQAKNEYILADKQARRRFQAHTIQDWLAAFRFANKAAVKW